MQPDKVVAPQAQQVVQVLTVQLDQPVKQVPAEALVIQALQEIPAWWVQPDLLAQLARVVEQPGQQVLAVQMVLPV